MVVPSPTDTETDPVSQEGPLLVRHTGEDPTSQEGPYQSDTQRRTRCHKRILVSPTHRDRPGVTGGSLSHTQEDPVSQKGPLPVQYKGADPVSPETHKISGGTSEGRTDKR